jgi:hypothetical protein
MCQQTGKKRVRGDWNSTVTTTTCAAGVGAGVGADVGFVSQAMRMEDGRETDHQCKQFE